ncbi:hypothetical protein C2G38_2308890 [Gigaspora rosea]|uniref:TLDc domain-containing protein n=1 Tax=Gigaspora rosea TaxID=44941 RepID=A0A397V8Y6_9GLOM|nr:hypothetical protein C2G38_2308890 [Gigaspora rosea]
MEEIKIWNRVIGWGIAQNSDLPTNPKNWSHKNFLSLKTTALYKIIYLISDIFRCLMTLTNNVQPYQQILEKNLWDNITKDFMSADRQNSEPIINGAHAAEIASWVDKKVYTYIHMSLNYFFEELEMVYKDSFWRLCAKQTHLVVIIKVKGTDEILGGYNPIGWDKPVKKDFCKRCKDSFIFH